MIALGDIVVYLIRCMASKDILSKPKPWPAVDSDENSEQGISSDEEEDWVERVMKDFAARESTILAILGFFFDECTKLNDTLKVF
jgi:hypothetical protein